jgi:hypothetical protein
MLFTVALVVVVYVFVSAAILEWLWNMTVPDVFSIGRIEYWQSFRLLIIASILFGPAIITQS